MYASYHPVRDRDVDEDDVVATARLFDPTFAPIAGDAAVTTYQRAIGVIVAHADRVANAAPPPTYHPTPLRALPAFEPRIYTAPDAAGIMHTIGMHTYEEMQQWLRVTMRFVILADGTRFIDSYDYFSLTTRFECAPDTPLPAYRWVACYAVTGGSEGHYVHVDLILDSDHSAGERVHVFTVKTFCGLDVAHHIAAALSCALGA